MRLLVESDPLRVRIALLDGERVVELQIEDDRRSSVGDIHLGRVQRLAPAIDAAFVDLGFERKAFLHANDFALGADETLQAHQPLIVQIFRDAVPGKGPRVRRGASLPGRYLVLLTTGSGVAVSTRITDEAERERLTAALADVDCDNVGWILRTAAAGISNEEISGEAAELLAVWRDVERRAAASKPPQLLHRELSALESWVRDRASDQLEEIWVDSADIEVRLRQALADIAPQLIANIRHHDGPETLFDRFDLAPQLAAIWQRQVPLPAGGSLVVEPTEALVAIDVNSGRDLAAANLEATALATNLEAARAAAQQLRLRDLAGIIVIDFIDMASDDAWEQVRVALEDELARDRATTLVEGPTAFGLMAVTRKRARNDLVQRLSTTCSDCGGSGRLRSAVEVVAEARRLLFANAAAQPAASWRLLLHPTISDDPDSPAAPLLSDLRQRLASHLEVVSSESQARSRFEIHEVTS